MRNSSTIVTEQFLLKVSAITIIIVYLPFPDNMEQQNKFIMDS